MYLKEASFEQFFPYCLPKIKSKSYLYDFTLSYMPV